MSSISYAEKAFLQLVARRLLRYQREAEARGETYQDLSPFAPLSCGVLAKFKFQPGPGGYVPVVTLRITEGRSFKELEEIASEILDGSVKLREAKAGDLEYVRESDAGASVPG